MSDAELYVIATVLKNLNQIELERLEATIDKMLEAENEENVLRPVS